MKLLMTIVQNSDANKLMNRLREVNFQSTKLASSGGFLREGNTTLMIGCEAVRLEEVLAVIKKTCSERSTKISPHYPMGADIGVSSTIPVEIEIGGAIVFVLPIDSFFRL